MTSILETLPREATALIRTDFSDDGAWELVRDAVTRPVDFDRPDDPEPGEAAYVPFIVVIEDRLFAGATGETLAAAVSGIHPYHHEALLADRRAMAEATAGGELTVAYVDLVTWDAAQFDPTRFVTGQTFRCATRAVALVEANLACTNLFFHEFAETVPVGGVYRG